MEAKDKIVRAKVHLQTDNPFFAYLVMNLNIRDKPEHPFSIGVSQQGDILYNEKWVDNLGDEELKSVLSHEVLHLALEHFARFKSKEKNENDRNVMNISTDLVINNILVNNHFRLPTGLVPQNNSYEFKFDKELGTAKHNFTITDLDKKSAEEVFNEILKKIPKIKDGMKGMSAISDERFDEHMESKGDGKSDDKEGKEKKEGKNQSVAGNDLENQQKWKRIFTEASIYAKQQGKLPDGVERLVDMVLNEKINWKNLLYKYITRELPYDYTYNRPSKRGVSTGIFMPSVLRENINIVVAVDTSGSIQQEELSDFLTEIVNISKSFSNIKMRVLFCDYEVHEDLEVYNGNIQTILEKSVKGGGGTSFKNPLNYIKENHNNTKFVIFFTDGYGDRVKISDYPFRVIWVITKNGDSKLIEDKGEIIKLE